MDFHLELIRKLRHTVLETLARHLRYCVNELNLNAIMAEVLHSDYSEIDNRIELVVQVTLDGKLESELIKDKLSDLAVNDVVLIY